MYLAQSILGIGSKDTFGETGAGGAALTLSCRAALAEAKPARVRWWGRRRLWLDGGGAATAISKHSDCLYMRGCSDTLFDPLLAAKIEGTPPLTKLTCLVVAS